MVRRKSKLKLRQRRVHCGMHFHCPVGYKRGGRSEFRTFTLSREPLHWKRGVKKSRGAAAGAR